MPELYVSRVLPIGFSDHLAIYGIRKLHRLGSLSHHQE